MFVPLSRSGKNRNLSTNSKADTLAANVKVKKKEKQAEENLEINMFVTPTALAAYREKLLY